MLLGDNPLLNYLRHKRVAAKQYNVELLHRYLRLGSVDEVEERLKQMRDLSYRFGDIWGKLLAFETISDEFGAYTEWAPILRAARQEPAQGVSRQESVVYDVDALREYVRASKEGRPFDPNHGKPDPREQTLREAANDGCMDDDDILGHPH